MNYIKKIVFLTALLALSPSLLSMEAPLEERLTTFEKELKNLKRHIRAEKGESKDEAYGVKCVNRPNGRRHCKKIKHRKLQNLREKVLMIRQ